MRAERRKTIHLQPVLWAAAAAIVFAAMLVYPKRHAAPPEQYQAVATASKIDSPPSVRRKPIDTAPVPLRVGHHVPRQKAAVHGTSSGACCGPAKAVGQTPNMSWGANEPFVQIAIPAAAMFPPGAVPEGVSFVADLSIAADGSVQQVRLQPQFSEFERRPSQP